MKKGYATSSEIQKQKERTLKRVLLGVACLAAIVLLVFVLSFALKGLRRLPGLPGGQTTQDSGAQTSSEAETDYVPPSGQAGFLIISAEPETGVNMLWFLDVNLDEQLVTVFSLDPAALCTAGELHGSLTQHYLTGGVVQLFHAVEELTGKTVERYVSVTDKNFLKVIKELGAVNVYVEEDVHYVSGDISLQLQKGMQLLDYNNLGNYLKYGAEGKEALLALQAEAMCSMLVSYFQNTALLKKGESVFTSLINLVDSDISAYDYHNNLRALEFLASGEVDFVTGGAISD